MRKKDQITSAYTRANANPLAFPALQLLLLLLLNEKIMVACCQRLRGHRTVVWDNLPKYPRDETRH